MAVHLIIGVDPGAFGAIAFLSPAGDLLGVEDVPIDRVAVGTGKRSRVAIPRLLDLLKGSTGAHAFIEQPTYRPMRRPNPQTGVPEATHMGVAGAGAFGENYGVVLASLIANGCVVTEVRPGVWSRAIKLHGGKDDSRRFACNLFPSQAALFTRKKDDGRSDAALIGYYGVRSVQVSL